MNIYIVGAGGVGGWLITALSKLLDQVDVVTIVDGDKVEEKNIERQVFDDHDVGLNKAVAMGQKTGFPSVDHYLTDYMPLDDPDLIFCCVDNHVARMAVLSLADQYACDCIIAANEYFEAEAYLYKPQWKDCPLDPRVYFPEMKNDLSGNPLAPGCSFELEEHPQLVSTNFLAAAFALSLYTFWFIQECKAHSKFWPVRYSHANGKTKTWSWEDQTEYGRQFV